MCDLCSTCTILCSCPRCPLRKGRLIGFPQEIQPCYVCGMEDDRECHEQECTIQEHYIFGGSMYCQMCVEEKHRFSFSTTELGMYCDKHEDAHKERMRAKLISRHFTTQEIVVEPEEPETIEA